MKKKFIIEVSTAWCGEDNQFGALAENESEIWDVANSAAYDNFSDFNGREGIAEELFPETNYEDLTDEQLEEIDAVEHEYYFSNIKEVEDDNDAEFFDNLEIIYGNEEEEITEEAE